MSFLIIRPIGDQKFWQVVDELPRKFERAIAYKKSWLNTGWALVVSVVITVVLVIVGLIGSQWLNWWIASTLIALEILWFVVVMRAQYRSDAAKSFLTDLHRGELQQYLVPETDPRYRAIMAPNFVEKLEHHLSLAREAWSTLVKYWVWTSSLQLAFEQSKNKLSMAERLDAEYRLEVQFIDTAERYKPSFDRELRSSFGEHFANRRQRVTAAYRKASSERISQLNADLKQSRTLLTQV